MTTINLKDFYYWYTQDQLIEVSDEVAEVFKADARYEMAYQRRLSRHKAQYSLDCDDGIEYSACLHEPTPQELFERMETFLRLWKEDLKKGKDDSNSVKNQRDLLNDFYYPRNHLNYIVNEEGLFLLQFGVRSKPSFFVAQKPQYLLAMRRKKGVFKHETHDSR